MKKSNPILLTLFLTLFCVSPLFAADEPRVSSLDKVAADMNAEQACEFLKDYHHPLVFTLVKNTEEEAARAALSRLENKWREVTGKLDPKLPKDAARAKAAVRLLSLSKEANKEGFRFFVEMWILRYSPQLEGARLGRSEKVLADWMNGTAEVKNPAAQILFQVFILNNALTAMLQSEIIATTPEKDRAKMAELLRTDLDVLARVAKDVDKAFLNP